MRVIITGGTGLIGRALATNLLNGGGGKHEVIVLSRNPHRVSGLPRGVQVVGWDGRSAQGWEHLIEGADAIVNLAGASLSEGRWTEQRKHLIFDSRVHAGQAVTQAIEGARLKPKVLVQASATGYYGSHGDEKITEDAPPGNDFLAQVCIAWEAGTASVEQWGVRRVVIRTGVVLSTRGGALPRMTMPFKMFVGGPLGSGRQWLPWIHIADEVGAIRFLIDKEDAFGPFNLTAPEPATNRQFSRVLGRVLGRPSVLPVPAAALRLMFGEMSMVLLEGQRAVPQRLLAAGYQFRFPDLEQALRHLLS